MNRELQKQHNWWNIIIQAGTCFFRQGIDKTSMKDIACHAGITSKTVERYFGTKENLILVVANAYIDHAFQEISGEYQKDVRGLNGFQMAQRFIQCEMDFFLNHPHDATGLLELELYLSKANYTEEELKDYKGAHQKLQECLVQALKQGQQDGSIREDLKPDEVGKQMELICLSTVQKTDLIRTDRAASHLLIDSFSAWMKGNEERNDEKFKNQ